MGSTAHEDDGATDSPRSDQRPPAKVDQAYICGSVQLWYLTAGFGPVFKVAHSQKHGFDGMRFARMALSGIGKSPRCHDHPILPIACRSRMMYAGPHTTIGGTSSPSQPHEPK